MAIALACLNCASSLDILFFLAIVAIALAREADCTPDISSLTFERIDPGPFMRGDIYF